MNYRIRVRGGIKRKQRVIDKIRTITNNEVEEIPYGWIEMRRRNKNNEDKP